MLLQMVAVQLFDSMSEVTTLTPTVIQAFVLAMICRCFKIWKEWIEKYMSFVIPIAFVAEGCAVPGTFKNGA